MAWLTTKNLQRFANGFSAKAMEIFAKITDIPESLPANGGNANTVNGHTVESNVPSGAQFTDTIYTHPSSSGSKHIPSGGKAGQVLKWKSDGEAQWGNETEIGEATDAEIDAIIEGTFKQE